MPRTHNVEDMSYEKNSLKQITWIVYETTWNSVPDAEIDRLMWRKNVIQNRSKNLFKKINARSRWLQIHRKKMLYSVGGIGAHLLKKKCKEKARCLLLSFYKLNCS